MSDLSVVPGLHDALTDSVPSDKSLGYSQVPLRGKSATDPARRSNLLQDEWPGPFAVGNVVPRPLRVNNYPPTDPTAMKRFLALSFLLLSLLTSVAFAQQLSVTPENPSGLYRIKAPVRWQVDLTDVNADTPVEARYEVCKDGAAKPIKTGNISLKAGHGLVEISLDEPCALMVNVSAKIGNKRLEKQAGAAVAPSRSAPRCRVPTISTPSGRPRSNRSRPSP